MILIPTMVAAFDATRERVAAALDTFDQHMTRPGATPTIDMEKVAAFSSAASPSTKTSAPPSAHQGPNTQNIAPGSVQGGNSNSRDYQMQDCALLKHVTSMPAPQIHCK